MINELRKAVVGISIGLVISFGLWSVAFSIDQPIGQCHDWWVSYWNTP